MVSRRNFLNGAGVAAAAVTASAVSKVAMAALPEPIIQTKPDTMPPLVPNTGRPYNPVVTLNGWTLPWRMNAGWKEFHLVAEPIVREIAPGMTARLWEWVRPLLEDPMALVWVVVELVVGAIVAGVLYVVTSKALVLGRTKLDRVIDPQRYGKHLELLSKRLETALRATLGIIDRWVQRGGVPPKTAP